MIVRKVAGLAHAHRVEHPIFMETLPRILIAAILPIATRAHILHTGLKELWEDTLA